jgi:uncharacterized protein (DUF433 family)
VQNPNCSSITIDREIMGGQPVFSGTRVPIELLFITLADGNSVKDFQDSYPTVQDGQPQEVLDYAWEILSEKLEAE